jgi:hypothetical protein
MNRIRPEGATGPYEALRRLQGQARVGRTHPLRRHVPNARPARHRNGITCKSGLARLMQRLGTDLSAWPH